MNMKPITEYVDYRKVILDFYNEKKQASVFSWREFAKSSGFSSAIFLKYVCEGKKNLSVSAAASVASAMSLAGFDAAYFNAMVVYASAKTDDDKMKAYVKSSDKYKNVNDMIRKLIEAELGLTDE